MLFKIIEEFLAMPEQDQAIVNAFLEKMLSDDEGAKELTERYNAGGVTREELYVELKCLYRR